MCCFWGCFIAYMCFVAASRFFLMLFSIHTKVNIIFPAPFYLSYHGCIMGLSFSKTNSCQNITQKAKNLSFVSSITKNLIIVSIFAWDNWVYFKYHHRYSDIFWI